MLAGYIRHVDHHGPECVIETAARDLDEHELGELSAYIKAKERAQRWRNGHWEERPRCCRPCELCGLDLPPRARRDKRFHNHCKGTARKRRLREKQPD